MSSPTEDRVRPTGLYRQGQMVAGRFEITRLLGEGGMGKVYLATQHPMGRRVALKVMRSDLVAEQASVRRFFREAVAISRLQHPNTVTLFDYGEAEDGALFIAMEYLDGASLKDLICLQVKLPWQRAANITAQVAGSLAEAHRKEIVHRDLKPDNIILSTVSGDADFVKVIDFGIAHLATHSAESRITRAGFVCGTPEYMSPEQARGDDLDGRSDLYSMGVILFEMLQGSLPFRGDTPLATVLQHQTGTPPELTVECPDALVALVLSMLAKDPADRPANAVELSQRLIDLAPDIGRPGLIPTGEAERRPSAGLALPTRPAEASLNTEELAETRWDEPVLPPRRRTGLWVAAGTVVLGAVVALVLAGGDSPTNRSPDPTAGLAEQTQDTETNPPVALPEATAAQPIEVTITSEPDLAQLYIDNRHIGLTPVSVELLPSERVSLILRKDGFEPHQTELSVSAEHTDGSLHYDLAPSPTQLQIASEPAGAEVIDSATGDVLGETPLDLSLERGEIPIEFELRLRRYRSAHRQVVPDRAEISLFVDLEAVPRSRDRDQRPTGEPETDTPSSPFNIVDP